MIWLTWRQFRAQAIAAAAGLAVLAVVFGVTRGHVAHLYDSSGLAACQPDGSCGPAIASFVTSIRGTVYEALFFVGIAAMYLVPAIIGLFWGAPLVARELESGTVRLAWTQGITRARWLAVKLGLGGLAAMAVAGLLSLMVSWWAAPINKVAAIASGHPAAATGALSIDRMSPLMFGATGVVPIGYAALAFVLGVAIGVLIRRTLPAMAIMLAVFAAVQVLVPALARPHLITPAVSVAALRSSAVEGLQFDGPHLSVVAAFGKEGAWVLSNKTITAGGQVYDGPTPRQCEGSSPFQACATVLGRLHLRQRVTYQPASRYWALQWYETAIYLAVALALAGFCFWQVRRRRVA